MEDLRPNALPLVTTAGTLAASTSRTWPVKRSPDRRSPPSARPAGRLTDAIASAELACLRLVDAVSAVNEMLAELCSEADQPADPVTPASREVA